jgi:outer membrane protein assembly factor BamD
MLPTLTRRLFTCAAAAMVLATLAGCASRGRSAASIAPEEQNADQYLFEKGNEQLAKRHWLAAREYFRKLVDTYPTSRYRQDAKLAIGDTYLGENRTETDVQAGGEFKEFLRFYPLAARADYAQYKLAESMHRQMLGPERDQTATHDALRELDVFIKSYPNSKLMPDVLKLQRTVQDELSESEFLVGRQYYRSRWYPGAVSRLEPLMKTDPQFTKRDGVYFFLAETYYKQRKEEQALPLYQRLVEEYRVSAYLKDAKARIAELNAKDTKPAADPEPAAATASTAPATTAQQTADVTR